MSYVEIAKGLLQFIDESPTCYHAVKNVANRLEAAGYQKLDEKERYDEDSLHLL